MPSAHSGQMAGMRISERGCDEIYPPAGRRYSAERAGARVLCSGARECAEEPRNPYGCAKPNR